MKLFQTMAIFKFQIVNHATIQKTALTFEQQQKKKNRESTFIFLSIKKTLKNAELIKDQD